jgi:hypothetical protein
MSQNEWVPVEQYNRLVDAYNRVEYLRGQDNNFYLLALNLTGDRDKYLDAAKDLIEKHGLISAMLKAREGK